MYMDDSDPALAERDKDKPSMGLFLGARYPLYLLALACPRFGFSTWTMWRVSEHIGWVLEAWSQHHNPAPALGKQFHHALGQDYITRGRVVADVNSGPSSPSERPVPPGGHRDPEALALALNRGHWSHLLEGKIPGDCLGWHLSGRGGFKSGVCCHFTPSLSKASGPRTATSLAAWRFRVLGISVQSSHHLITQRTLKSAGPGSSSSLLNHLGEVISPCNPYPYNMKITTISRLG